MTLYEPDGYRSSDHDPVVVGLTPAHFDFSGLFSPVDNPPEYNVMKAGAAVPVKFSLGGDQGLDILAAGSPTSRPVACDALVPSDPVEETATAGASSLTYDASRDQYVYTWKTDKRWAGSCRLLSFQLTDGSIHTALFSFTR